MNGVATGTERSTTSTTDVSFTENISVVAGDLIQLYIKASAANVTAYNSHFTLGAKFMPTAEQIL